MGRAELVPQIPGRPATVQFEGWTVYVGVRDAAYLREKRAWRRVLREAHPDRHPVEEKGKWTRALRLASGKRLAWHQGECQWYAKLGLLPPDGSRTQIRLVERRRRLKGLPPAPDARLHTAACSAGREVG